MPAPPDVVHGHFWMSGLAALDAARRADRRQAGCPVIQTFHALGTVKRRHQGSEDTSPPQRRWLEPSVGRSADRIIATCSDEVFELKAMGIDTGQDFHRPVRGGPGALLRCRCGRAAAAGPTASSPWAGWFRARAWTW